MHAHIHRCLLVHLVHRCTGGDECSRVCVLKRRGQRSTSSAITPSSHLSVPLLLPRLTLDACLRQTATTAVCLLHWFSRILSFSMHLDISTQGHASQPLTFVTCLLFFESIFYLCCFRILVLHVIFLPLLP